MGCGDIISMKTIKFGVTEYELSGLSKIIQNYLQYCKIYLNSTNIYSAPTIIQACLGTRNLTTNKTDKSPYSHKVYIPGEKQIKQDK